METIFLQVWRTNTNQSDNTAISKHIDCSYAYGARNTVSGDQTFYEALDVVQQEL